VSHPTRGRRALARAAMLAASVLFSLAGCGAAAPATRSTPPSPAAPPVADAATFAKAACEGNRELSDGFGNPDSNAKSVAWKAFDTAAAGHDGAQIDAAADAVVKHLEAARAANARAAMWPSGAAASAEFEIILVGLEQYIGSVRQARGEPAAAAQAQQELGKAWPHLLNYWQDLQQLAATGAIPMTQLPC
jgi:predicted small lipoprotein YifL